MDRQIADGEHDDDNDEHFRGLAPRAQLQFNRGVRIDGEQVLAVVARHAAIPLLLMLVLVVLLRHQAG